MSLMSIALMPRFISSICLALVIVTVSNSVVVVVGQEPISVMTYNIRYLNNRDGDDIWKNRSATVIETIKTSDVVGLQEVVAAQLEDIKAGTPEFTWYGVGRDDGAEKGEMTAIGWRTDSVSVVGKGTFWLSPNPEEVGVAGWDAALPRIASWIKLARTDSPTRPLLLLNTHFDHIGKTARENSAKLLRRWSVEQHEGKLPVVLLGDLNAKTTDAPLQRLLESTEQAASTETGSPRFVDAREASNVADSGPNTTWNGFKALAIGSRIDHVLTLGQVDVLEYETLNPKTPADRFASDHLPIQVRINW